MDRTAGRNVSEPTTEMKTTEIVPIAIERNSGSSSRNRPAIEIITARPEKNTARPAVLDAVWIARSFSVSSPCSIRRAIDQTTMPPMTATAAIRTGAESTTDSDDERGDRDEREDHPTDVVVPGRRRAARPADAGGAPSGSG